MAKLVNCTGKHIEIHQLVNGTVQGNASLSPGESMNWSGRNGVAAKYWIRGNTGTKKIIETEDHNGVYDLY